MKKQKKASRAAGTTKATTRYILLPPRGLAVGDVGQSTPKVASFLVSLHTAMTTAKGVHVDGTGGAKVKVLDSIHENGAKLVAMSPDDVSALRAEQPGIRVVPEVFYHTARARRPEPVSGPTTAAAGLGVTIKVTVVSDADGTAIAGATVVAFTNFAKREGAQAKTTKKGVASLSLGASSKKVERLYVYAENGFWNSLSKNITLTSTTKIALQPIDLSFTDSLRHFYGKAPTTGGKSVIVGVIDTGIGPHHDLNVAGGENTVVGEDPTDFADNGEGHGTHVGGIIAARGTPPKGIRGLAPAVTLRSYRVFGKGNGNASNFSIAKAIDRAVADRCDVINMSLGGGPQDEATHSAIADARAKGTIVIAATGNDDRGPVSFPGADPLVIAVTALGRKGTFPSGTVEAGDVVAPFGTDKKNYIASFSNVGPEVHLTAPGDGIISTFPGNRYAIMDGTSMASPAAAGAAARVLAGSPVLSQPRDQARSDAMAEIVLKAAKKLGFAATLEGQGLIGV